MLSKVSSTKRIALKVGIGFWLLAPLAALAILTAFASAQSLAGPKVNVWVPVEASTDDVTTQIDIALSWTAEPALVAPSWSGIVQAVYVKRGDLIQDGTLLTRIDGIDRIAVKSAEPFYRPIGLGDKGRDVEELHSLLARRELPSASGSVATRATVQGIRKLGESIGVTDARTFDPGWVVYLASETVMTSTVDLRVGAAAPSLGSSVASSIQKLSAATIVPLGSLDRYFETTSSANGDSRTQPEPPDIEALATPIPSSMRLHVGNQDIEIAENLTSVADGSLEFLASISEPTMMVIQANVTRAAQPNDVVIPTATIFAGEDGTVCVRRLRGGSVASVKIQMVADSNGRAIVRGQLRSGDQVQVGVSGSARRCG